MGSGFISVNILALHSLNDYGIGCAQKDMKHSVSFFAPTLHLPSKPL